MNLLAYILYLLITYFITVHAGQMFYRNGIVYVLDLLDGNRQLADYINRMLLTGYYLLNLGYVALTLSEWRPGSCIQLHSARLLHLSSCCNYSHLVRGPHPVQERACIYA